MMDIPPRSFGSTLEWHCCNDNELLMLLKCTFPLPSQQSWTVFQFSTKIATRVISTLQMQAITMDKWQQLPQIGKHVGTIRQNMSNLWAWTLTFRGSPTPNGCMRSQTLQHKCSKEASDRDSPSRLGQLLTLSQPLDRGLRWPVSTTPQKLVEAKQLLP
jgi:hypothetical protein